MAQGRSSYTPARLLVLLEQLPEGAEYGGVMAGGREHRDWGVKEYLQASTINSINNMMLTMANASKKDRANYPMVTGPLKPKQKRRKTNSDILAMLNGNGDAGGWDEATSL